MINDNDKFGAIEPSNGLSGPGCFRDVCNSLRAQIKNLAGLVNETHGHQALFTAYGAIDHDGSLLDGYPDAFEMHANLTLAYRHLEDAAMRLGKAIQSSEGGVSCYDKTTPPHETLPPPFVPPGKPNFTP